MQERQRADLRIKVMKQVRALSERKARRLARENTQLLVRALSSVLHVPHRTEPKPTISVHYKYSIVL